MAISTTSNSADPWGILNSSQRKRTIPVQKSAMLSRHPWEIIHKKLGWILSVTSTICWYVGCVLQTSFQNQLQNSEICKNKTHTHITSSLWSLWHVLQLCFSYQALRAKFRQSLHRWYRQGLSRRRSQGDSERYLRVFIAAVDGHDVHF